MRELNLLKTIQYRIGRFKFLIEILIPIVLIFYNINTYGQCQTNSGEISGTVYNDTNFNGVPDITDMPLAGIKVSAYDIHQQAKAVNISDSDGKFHLLGLTDGVLYRIEFEYPEGFYPVAGYKDITFSQVPACDMDLLLQKPVDYTYNNPDLALSMFLQGRPSQYKTYPALLSFQSKFAQSEVPNKIASKEEVGSVFGVAFMKTTQQLFTSAFVKQYVYLGPGGLGAIYTTRRTVDGWKTSLYVDLIAQGIDIGTLNPTDAHDCDYGAQVGKIGLGAIALSGDEKYLYVVNIYKNEIVKIPTDKSKINEIEEIPVPDPQCVGGYRHTFALKYHDDKLYVGVTCGAEISKNESNSTVTVYEYDPMLNVFGEIFSTDYPKGYLHDQPSFDVNTQHWITDIDFTDEGNMIIVLNDRTGHRYCGISNSRLDIQNGDILLVWNNNGTWELENNGHAGIYTGSGVDNGEGPGGGEFFGFDYWPTNHDLHPETITGTALVLEGTGEVIAPCYDPEEKSYSGGVKRYNTSNGEQNSVFSLYTHTIFPQMGKASGFGDLDAIYDPLPLEIGDYIWYDKDKDGIQDPDENGFSGISVSLYDENCNKVGSTITDAEGYYYFDKTNVDLNNDGVFESPDILQKYYVVIDDSRFVDGKMNINGKTYFLTVLNKGFGTNRDKNDNDASIATNICNDLNGKPYIAVYTRNSGQTLYDADFGFAESKIFDLALRKVNLSNKTVHYGDIVTFKITVFNQGNIPAHDIVVSDYLNSGFEVDYTQNQGWSFPADKPIGRYKYESTLLPGDSVDIYIQMKVKAGAKLEDLVNYAEISSALDPDNNPGNDVDSVMDEDPDNDIGGTPDFSTGNSILVTDNLIDDDGSIDEDDHDPGVVKILDLALQKVVLDQYTIFTNGDTVTFGFNIFNQGNVIATSYDIVDYLPDNLIFDSNLNPDWIKNSDTTVLYSVNEELLPFTQNQIKIKLIISPDANVNEIFNYGEISHITTRDDSNPKDYDSVPNLIRTDDLGGQAGTSTDNQVNGSPMSNIPDEDDQDVAAIMITNFDLALTKKALNHNIEKGDNVEFEIEVFNQGAITADKITLVDYLDQGFVLNDTKWNYYPNDSSRVEILLSAGNGLLPVYGLLPGKSVKIKIKLYLKDVADGVDFLVNEVEIKSAYDISGNNMGQYDKDSTPDDIKGNDAQGSDNQLDGNGVDDEDDDDWSKIFVRSDLIFDPCVCLHNATNEDDGQFAITISIISPSGENWEIDSLVNFYDIASPQPPLAPSLYTVGTVMTEDVDNPASGLSTYTINGIQIDDIGYYVRFINNLGDIKIMDMTSGFCSYDDIVVSGATGTCLNSTEDYSIVGVDPTATYTWTLPGGGGSFDGGSIGTDVTIDWGGVNGIFDVVITPTGGTDCLVPKTFKVKVGNSAGSMILDDYVIGSVDTICELKVTPEVVISTPVDSTTPFKVIIIDPDGNILPDNIITSEYIGMDMMVKVIDQCSGQQGMSIVKAIDKQKPKLACQDIEVDCDRMTDYPGPVASDNCDSNPEVFFTNETIDYQDCTSPFTKVITREYVAEDKYGNLSKPCVQHISVKRLNKAEVVFPDNFLIADNTALTCNTFEVDGSGNPAPTVTGTPYYHGKDLFTICNNNFCETTVGYHDFIVADDGCKKIIQRTWFVFENCEDITYNNIISHIQTIEIHDLIPPVPVAPANLVVTTNGWNCNADVLLPELEIKDNCSTEFRVDIIYPGGMKENSNGGLITLPVGVHHVIYNVYDQCNNLSQVDLTVTVLDKTAPVAICQTNTTVSLNSSGEADAPALAFDSGSYDDCGVAGLEVRRMFNDDFGQVVHFDCNDLDSTNIMIVLRVTDYEGNWDECMVNVTVQHKYPPKITCPDNMQVECDFPYEQDSLSKYFGNASGVDVCGITIEEDDPVMRFTDCGTGYIKRHFIATGRGGLQVDCYQKIDFENSHPFSESDITWPASELTTNICGIDQLSPSDFGGWPVLNEDQCDLVSMNYSDQTFFGIQDSACYTIVRSWTVLDQCQIENGTFKRWHFDQLIHIENNVDPFIEPLQNIDTCTYDTLCQSGYVTLEAIGSDDCTAADDLQWTYKIDLNNNGTFDIQNHQVGRKAIASGTYPIGTHKILWQVEDRCGNVFVRSQLFTIKNCKKPTAICKDKLVVELGPALEDGDTIAVADILAKLFDGGSYHSCGYPLKYSFSLDVTDTILYLDCSWIRQEEHDITLFVTDTFGNVDYCNTHLTVQDNYYICNPFDRCISYPLDSVVVESCNPDLDPGHGIMDSLIVDNSCGCDDFDIDYTDTDVSDANTTCQTIKREWSVDFNCTDLDTIIYFVQTITVKNHEAPALTCANDITVDASASCDSYVSIPIPTYNDSGCNTGLVITHNSPYADNQGANASGTYPGGINMVTFTLTDDCGNNSQCSLNVIVQDVSAPLCISNDTTVALGADGTVIIDGSYVASGSSDNCGILSITVNPNSFDCGDIGGNNVNITISDNSGNQSNCTAVVTIIDTLTQLCNARDATIYLDENGEVILNPQDIYAGSGGCGGSSDVSLVAEPDTFYCDDIGENTVQLIVTDNTTGLSDTCDAIVTVLDTIAPQCLVHNTTVYLNDNGNITIDFSDIDNGSNDQCGVISSIDLSDSSFDCNDTGNAQTVVVTLTDPSNNTSTCEAEITVLDTIAPLCQAIDTILYLDSDGTASLTGNDIGSSSTDNCGISSISVEPDTFNCDDLGDNNVTVTVTDNSGNQSTCEAIVTVVDTITQLCNAQDATIYLDENGEVILNPQDIYAGSGGCGGSSDVSLVAEPDTFYCDDIGENTVQLIVTDNTTGESDTCEAIVTVLDTIAPLCMVHDTTVYLDDNGNATIDFADIDNGSTDQCGVISSIDLSDSTFDCNNTGNAQTVVVTLTDPSNNTSTCEAEITVLDTIAPVCQSVDTITVYLDENGMAVIIGADVDAGSSDNCGIDNITVEPDTFMCSDVGEKNIDITVTDNSNNQSFCTSIAIVLDTVTQLCMAHDTILYLDENGFGVLDPYDIYSGDGGCGGSDDITLIADPDTFSCDDIGENFVQLIVIDNVTGNTDTCGAVVTVIDTIAPVCLVHDTDVYLDENGSAHIVFGDIDNGSYDPCGIIVDTLLSDDTFDCTQTDTVQVVTVTLTDNSNNTSICQAGITVLDTIAPQCEAVDTLLVYLDTTGMVVINGQNVDNGSSDQCGYISLEVEPDTFYCNDASIPVEFTLTVTDNSGNTSQCTGIAIPLDTIPPTIICPVDTTISCTDVPEEQYYIDEFGEPVIYDNCSQGGDYTETDVKSIDNCGAGFIARNFQVSDPSGNTSMCTQLITIESTDNFGEEDITWPADTVYVENCYSTDPDSINSFPVIDYSDAECSDITTDYEDTNLTPGGSCNDTIQRVWTIVDSCQYDMDSNTGIYIDTQIIIVFDTLAPLIYAPNDTLIEVTNDECQNVFVNLYGYVVDCDPNVVVSNDSPYADDPNSADASGYYPGGVWDITITATDQCGNSSTYTYNLQVEFPSYCVKGFFYIQEGDSVVVYVDDVTTGVPDCADMSFSNSDPALDSIVFYCPDVDENHLTPVYKFDQNGVLIDSCISDIKIEDPNGFCSGNLVSGLKGVIMTEYDEGVENAEVQLSGDDLNQKTTNVAGRFEFMPLNDFGYYSVKPVKNDDVLNGVSTVDIINIQKHILGISKLNSPYKIISADIDNNNKISASDILHLRKIILGDELGFANNNSWKFIDASYVFENSDNPLYENYPQEIVIENLDKIKKLEFVGVKIGDVNNSAWANSKMDLENRNAENTELYSEDRFVKSGEDIIIKILTSEDIDIEGVQFTLGFNTDYLEYSGFENELLDLNQNNLGIKHLDEGLLTVSWNNTSGLEIAKDGKLFSFRFKVSKSGFLSDLVEINNKITSAIIIDDKENEKGVLLKFRKEGSEDFVLYQNEPNPWSFSTNFKFELPESGDVKITITNGYSAMLYSSIIKGKAGKNIFSIDKNKINYSGLLFVDFEYKGKHQVKKMIKIY